MQKNDMLIYSMDLDEDDTQNKDYLSTTSKSDQYKTTPSSPQLPNAQTIDTLHPTQIIKINPNPNSQPYDLNQNQQYTTIISTTQTSTLENTSTNNQDKSEQQYEEEEYPNKVKKPRRKRLESPLKRRKNLEQQISDYENTLQIYENQNYTGQISPNYHSQNIKDQNESIHNNWQFQTIEKQSNGQQKPQKLHSYLQMEDSQRNFQVKKQQNPKLEPRFTKTRKLHNPDSSLQLSNQQQVKEILSCQVLIDDFSADSEDYKDSSNEEQVYENEDVFEEEEQAKFSTKRSQITSPQPIKIVKQLPKQVLIETTLQSLVMKSVPKNMKMVCRFCVQTKYFGMSKQFNLVIEQTGQTIVSAKKEHFSFTGSRFIISFNKDFVSKRKENEFWAGRLQSNFYGTSYQLSQRNFAAQNSSIKKSSQPPYNESEDVQNSDKYEQSLVAIINFENNLWGFSGIRKMEILKVDNSKLTKKDIMKSVTLEDILQRNQLSKLTKIQTTKPQYNKATKRYSLNFEKKAKIPSSKNIKLHWNVPEIMVNQNNKNSHKLKNSFSNIDKKTQDQSTQLRSSEDSTIQKGLKKEQNKDDIKKNKMECLLIGKQSQKQYLVEIGHPLSIFEAFGACLANQDTKYMVN